MSPMCNVTTCAEVYIDGVHALSVCVCNVYVCLCVLAVCVCRVLWHIKSACVCVSDEVSHGIGLLSAHVCTLQYMGAYSN